MEVSSLASFGYPSGLLDAWATSIGSLNELQVEAINEYKVLDGQHLVVVAPTSSGKTMTRTEQRPELPWSRSARRHLIEQALCRRHRLGPHDMALHATLTRPWWVRRRAASAEPAGLLKRRDPLEFFYEISR